MTWYSNSQGRYGANGAKGDLGEKLVEEYCLNNGISYQFLSDVNSQVNLKIDCVVDGINVDVKTNVSNDTLVVELYSRKKKPGWLFTTTAKQIYGVDIDKKQIYRYNVREMVDFVVSNKQMAKKTKKGDVLMWVPLSTSFIERLQ